MAKIISPVRGEIYLVNFDPTLGSEIKKTRPALVIQNDVANQHSPITIVAAITSKYDDRLFPTEILIPADSGGLKQDSVVLLNQIRSIDGQRLVKRIGNVEPDLMKKVDLAIKISLGLIQI